MKSLPLKVKTCAYLKPRILSFSDSIQEEEFYTYGSLDLLEARRRIAEFSLPRLDLSR